MKSIAVIEIKTIAKGYLLADYLLKRDNITLITAQAMCPGKFVLIISGMISSVENACEFAMENFKKQIIDISKFGRISEEVYRALIGTNDVETKDAIGIIETFSIASIIEAADIAVKSAATSIVELRVASGMGGKSYLMITGSVSNVSAALKNGEIKPKQEGMLVDTELIASPSKELWSFI